MGDGLVDKFRSITTRALDPLMRRVFTDFGEVGW